MADSCEKKKLNDLRVVDLKSELERRALETGGVKTILIERLEKALRDEGHNPEEYLFEISIAKGKAAKPATPVKGNKEALATATDQEKQDSKEEEKPLIESTNGAENDANESYNDDELVLKDECFEDVERIDSEQNDSEEKNNEKPKEVQNEGPTSSPNVNAEDESKQQDIDADTSNLDNEDSINLTIGEEEAKLFHDEDDIKPKDPKADEKLKNSNSVEGDKKVESDPRSLKESSSSSSSAALKASKDEASSGTTSNTPGGGGTSSGGTTEKKKITAPSPGPSATSSTAMTTTTTNASNNSRNLWVSGLSSLTRATDLKQVFSKYGKVVGAKIVTNTRTANQKCFGYVTMATFNDASECIKHLHRTELHGRTISVERAKSDLTGAAQSKAAVNASKSTESVKGAISNNTNVTDKRKEIDAKKNVHTKESETKKADASAADDTSNNKKKEDDSKSTSSGAPPAKSERKRISPPRSSREKSRDRHREFRKSSPIIERRDIRRRSHSREILSYDKMREERERKRREMQREARERELREEERRRREIRRRQYEEEQRLAREREKLELERIKIAKEKAELLRIQRERQKLELEKIELERLELKRQQRKIEEEKRAIKRPLASDHYDDDRDRKRSTSDRRFEAPPPPRFEKFDLSRSGGGTSSSQYDRDRDRSDIKKRLDDYPKRDDFSSKGRDDYKRDSYKSTSGGGGTSSRDDYKRDVDIPRSSFSSSSRIDSSSLSVAKDRYSDRPTSSDYRGGVSRNEDSRNVVSKSRYFETPNDSRYDRTQNSATSWNTHQQFSGVSSNPSGDVWSGSSNKQPPSDSGNAWRGSGGGAGIDDGSRDYRFGNADRKSTQHYSNMDSQSIRSNPYMGNGNPIIPQQSARFNSQRWQM